MTEIANTEQFEAWNGDSGRRWVADPERRDQVIAEVGEILLAASRLVAGERVLDIGCGCGATTLAAARRVLPGGAAIGVDLSAPMLAVARERAHSQQIENATFEQADAQTVVLEAGECDVAISRFGTMFFADPTAAFINIASALRDGGRLHIATWQPLVANDWLTIPGAALLTYGSMPDGGDATRGAGMFAQSDPAVIASTLTAAGFAQIDIVPSTPTLHLGSTPSEAAAHLTETGPGRAVLETVPESERASAITAVEDVLSEHITQRGVELCGAIWLTTAFVSGR
ncbi:MAG TPA: class I SAM-dependent methyltransferase [Acidimicrobiia bacterium]|jgi:SAM-dependent methyltransferase|nr:class I SAM-dependent methyltransferase [Acidimicrobiia bacterium]